MSKKPKPHELRKRENRVKRNLERPNKSRSILPERHLFVTEGTKTEPNYLDGMIKLINERYGIEKGKQFNIIGEADNTLNLLSKAEAYQQNDAEGYQHVWIIYDKDDFPPDNFDNTAHRCEDINKREGSDVEFHVLWSNECFELWLLLHFCYMDANISREEYQEKLSAHLGKKYEKNDVSIFQTLHPHMKEAIKNAKRLMRNYNPKLAPSKQAPGTNFYELVEKLEVYMTDSYSKKSKGQNIEKK